MKACQSGGWIVKNLTTLFRSFHPADRLAIFAVRKVEKFALNFKFDLIHFL